MHVKPVFLFLYLSSHNVIPVHNAQLYRTLKMSFQCVTLESM
ncbi:MAG: hypothetical protein ACEY3L_16480 [Wolbachia sp.]